MQKFILHWGEMGARWGINRTVGQIHALLYLSPRPMNAEEIADTLGVARSNVSTSLKELQNWGIVRIAHVMGDRRDHFESMKDVWEMFRVIMDERKKRETDPTLHCLRELNAEAKKGGAGGRRRGRRPMRMCASALPTCSGSSS
jgi:DNA-binding transcriptional regulator GbsR (MarR family)